jgi:hypothetical protein
VRGLASAAALIAIALACLTITRKLERERRLLAKLRKRAAIDSGAAGIALNELSDQERDAAESLATAGVLDIQRNRVCIKTVELSAFRKKRLRLMVTGGFGAFLLACLVALLILHR